MPSLLIADDFTLVRNTLCNYFETMHIATCSQAKNGLEAVEMTIKSRPDLVILDYSMPIMSGLAAAKAIHEASPLTTVFLISAHGHALDSVKDDSIAGVFCKNNVGPLFQAVKDHFRQKVSLPANHASHA